ncbi:MAG: hypothetical protein QXT71_01895 [Thermoplasmata archaeon]
MDHLTTKINVIFYDFASGISFEKRKEFFELLNEVMDYNVEKVIIAYKDRLIIFEFELFNHLFNLFGNEIVVMPSGQ